MDRERIETMLRHHEGVRNVAYQDTKGIWTVGVGHNLNEPLSDAAVSQIFQDDLTNVIIEAENAFPWFHELDEVRQAAVIDLLFNMGLPTFLTFVNTITHIAGGRFDEAGDELLRGSAPGGISWYYHDVGRRAETISRMLKTGEWQ